MSCNCPHCSNPLIIPPSQMKESWSFIRCFECGGFAMMRASAPAPTLSPSPSFDTRRPVILASTRKKNHASVTVSVPLSQKKNIARSTATPPPFKGKVLKIPQPLPGLSTEKKHTQLTPWFTAALAMLVLAIGLRIQQVQRNLSAEISPTVASSSKVLSIEERRRLVRAAPKDTVTQVSAPNLTDLIDQVKQQSLAPARTSKP